MGTTELAWDDFFTSHLSDEALELIGATSAGVAVETN